MSLRFHWSLPTNGDGRDTVAAAMAWPLGGRHERDASRPTWARSSAAPNSSGSVAVQDPTWAGARTPG